MSNSSRLAQNYNIRRGLFYLLAPLVGVGQYIINTQMNKARSLDDIPLVSLHAVQVKHLATENSVLTDSQNRTYAVAQAPSGPTKPSGNV